MRTKRLRFTVLAGLALFASPVPGVIAGETPATESAVDDGRRLEGSVLSEQDDSSSPARWIVGRAAPVVNLDLRQFLKTDGGDQLQMSTSIPDAYLPRGYRRMRAAETAARPPNSTGIDPHLWAPTWADFDLLLATPTAGPDPCRNR